MFKPAVSVVILREPLPKQSHAGPNDRIIRCVVVGTSPKDVHPNYSLLESIFIPLQSFMNDIAQ